MTINATVEVLVGNGISEIVALFIVADETKLMIETAVKIFQKYNSIFVGTGYVFTKLFPNATLQICLFHTQRSFKREVKKPTLNLKTKYSTSNSLFKRIVTS